MVGLAALGLLGLYLLVGWVISAASGDWSAASQDYPLSATGTAFLALALAVGRPISPPGCCEASDLIAKITEVGSFHAENGADP